MEKHYLGEDVTLKFDTLVNGKPIKPLNVTAAIYQAKGKFVSWGKTTIKKEEVSCKISHKDMNLAGDYVAVFDVQLPYLGKKEHVMQFKIIPLPVSRAIRKEVSHANSLS